MSVTTTAPLTGRSGGFAAEEIAAARTQVGRAFALRGAVSPDGDPVCVSCGTARKGKVRLFPDGGWHCYKCGSRGDAIDLLRQAGWTFPAAVADLLGRPCRRPRDVVPAKIVPGAAEAFRAVVDTEVYRYVLTSGSREAAQDFYAAFGVDPRAVAESGAVMITNHAALLRGLVGEFGIDRLVASGLAMPSDTGTRLMVNRQYPVIEPHLDAAGTPTGLQFRAGPEQVERIAAHKRGEGAYVPKFLSLRGAGSAHLLGCGLPRLNRLPSGAKVRICEGFKDLLAARTLGWEAYALPGAGTMPPEAALEVLRRHRLMVMFDGDEAGLAGAQRLTDQLRDAGCEVIKARLTQGMDIADVLARRALAS